MGRVPTRTATVRVVQSLAAFVASDFSSASADNQAFYEAMAERSYAELTPEGAAASGIRSNHMEFAASQRAVVDAESRFQVEEGTLKAFVDEIEGVDKEEIAVKLLSLRTTLEVSYQATSITLGLTLSNYL